MTIEFDCPHCGKLLRTSDDKAGRSASCPGCESSITIPTHGDIDVPTESYGDAQAPSLSLTVPPNRPSKNTRSCPVCGEQIAFAATCCPACGEVVGRSRSDFEHVGYLKPHRAGLLLSMSILSWIVCFACACCIIFGLAGAATAIATVVFANQDLREMRDGRMDPSGESVTQAARGITFAQLLVGALLIAVYVTFLLFGVFGNNLRQAFGF